METLAKKRVEEYWFGKLSGYRIEIPYTATTGAGPVWQHHVSRPAEKALQVVQKAAKGNRQGIFALYLVAFAILVKKYFGISDIMVCEPGDALGPSPLFYRFSVTDQCTVRQLIDLVREEVEMVGQYHEFDYLELQPRFRDRNVEEQSLFCFGLSTRPVPANERTSFSLIMPSDDVATPLTLRIEKGTFRAYDLASFPDHMCHVLGTLRQILDLEVSNVNVSQNDNANPLLNGASNPRPEFPVAKTIHQLFQEQVRRTPERVAVAFEGRSWTYEKLNRESNKLAHYIRSILPDPSKEVVGIILERSDLTILCILGILKAGAAFVPIDAALPEKRRAFIIDDIQPKILITSSGFLFELSGYSGNIFAVDIQLDSLDTPASDPEHTGSASDKAYIMYTSGSTGKPKGVIMHHGAVVNFIFGMQKALRQSDAAPCNIALVASFNFDPSMQQTLMALFYGHTLFIVSDDTKRSAEELWSFFWENGIHLTDCTPTHFGLLVSTRPDKDKAPPLKHVIVGGEALHRYKVEAFFQLASACGMHTIITNVYGPTECCVNASYYTILPTDRLKEDIVPIGNPLPNYTLYLVDQKLNSVPQGVPGELCIGGPSVGGGYWNRADLTRERFIENPFATGTSALLYRTGDICCLSSEGYLVFLGRKDNQVKIRGHRIEVDEVANVLSKMEGIRGLHLALKENEEDDKCLVAYYTSEQPLPADHVRDYLRDYLPDYMIPAHFANVAHIPTTPNGKVDEHALPWPLSAGTDYVAPENELETTVSEVFARILDRDRVSVLDNFFEVGGDSIIAIRGVSILNKAIGVSIAVKDVFLHQTPRALAAYIASQRMADSGGEEIEVARRHIDSIRDIIENDADYRKFLPDGWEDVYPMSDVETGIVYHYLLNPSYGVYHDLQYSQLEDAQFSYDDFRNAFLLLVRKHPMLRTSFILDRFKVPMQVVHAFQANDVEMEYLELAGLSKPELRRRLEEFAANDRRRPFDLSKPCLFRIKVFKLSATEIAILWISHHAIMDGWSSASLMTELSNVYYSVKIQKSYNPPALTASYKDFVIIQDSLKNNVSLRKFWARELEGYQRTPVPFNKEFKTLGLHGDLASHTFFIEPGLHDALRRMVSLHKVSIKSIFLAAFQYLLAFTTNTRDVTVGLVTHARPAIEDGDRILGCFVNTIPFRTKLDTGSPAIEFLRSVNDKTGSLKTYDQLSLLEITKATGHVSGDQNPIYDNLFNFVDFHIYKERHSGVTITEPLIDNYTGTNLPFNFEVNITQGMTSCLVTAQPGLYSQQELARIGEYYTGVLRHLAFHPEAVLTAGMLASVEEKSILGSLMKGVEQVHPEGDTIVSLFERQAMKSPGRVAVVSQEEELSYEALNRYANAIAKYLLDTRSVKRGDRIGVMMAPSVHLVAAFWGVLKAGCVYCPIDVNLPDERRMVYLNNADVKSCLVEDETSGLQGAVFPYDGVRLLRHQIQPAGNPEVGIGLRDLCYIIYTSGTSGVPNGVLVEHRTLNNLALWYAGFADITSDTRSLLVLPIGFDASIKELATPLVVGGSIATLPSGPFDPYGIASFISKHRISFLNASPSAFNQILLCDRTGNYPNLQSLEKVALGGEMLSTGSVAHFMSNSGCTICNVYGPTEGGDIACAYTLTQQDLEKYQKAPIGKPITNARVYILDTEGHPVLFGVEGEIYISGEGVSRGYLDKAELSHAKFSVDPFAEKYVLYRTGDRAKYLETGDILFLGRTDDQLKIRGNRVELKEIQAKLKCHPAVSDAVVIATTVEGENQQVIIAYVCLHSPLHTTSLRAYLAGLLPGYMIPAYFSFVDRLPLTVNGKVDVQALPRITKNHDTAPADLEEMDAGLKVTLAIFREVIGVSDLSIHDNFLEAGGDSIKAIQIAARMRSAGLLVDIKDIYQNPTASSLTRQARLVQTFADQSTVEGIVPLTPIQRHFFEQPGTDLHFNNAVLMQSDEPLDIATITDILRFIQNHHDALRMTYREEGGKIIQYNHGANFPLAVTFHDLSADHEPFITAEQICYSIQNGMDLEQGSLMKTAIFRFRECHYLFMTIHHLVVDNVSWNILKEDFFTLLQQHRAAQPFQLPPKTHSYKFWAEQMVAASDAFQPEETYWREIDSRELKLISHDFPTGENRVKYQADISLVLTPEETLAVSQATRYFDAEVNDILLAAMTSGLYQTFGYEQFKIAFEGHGREQITEALNVTRTVGWFTSMYPVILEAIHDKEDVSLQVTHTKTILRKIPNKGIGYGIVREKIRKGRDPHPAAIPQISYNFFGSVDGGVAPSGFQASNAFLGPEQSAERFRSFDIIVMGAIAERQLTLTIEYASSQFKKDTMATLKDNILKSIHAVIDHVTAQPDIRYEGLSALDLNKVSELFNNA